MPEGPEVETIRRGLEGALIGRTFESVEVLFERSFEVPKDVLRRDLIGARVEHVERRGKMLSIILSSGSAILIHLKMTGQLVVDTGDLARIVGGHPTPSMDGTLPDSSTRVVFGLSGGATMFFNDQRKFGWIKLVRQEDIGSDEFVRKLGPEILSSSYSVEYLEGQLKRHSRAPIKAVLLDQAVVAGLGNIYVDESLNLARIHPLRRAGSISAAEAARLHAATLEIMRLGIEHGGTSFSHFVNADGSRGDYLAHARVFNRVGLACPKCGDTIVKIRVAGRGTYVCNTCQKLEA